MRKRQKKIVCGLIACALSCVWVGDTAAQNTHPQESTDTSGNGMAKRSDEVAAIDEILKAMQLGDAPTLTTLYQSTSEPVVHVWAAMALERVHFNLDAATADAKICEQNLFETRPSIALLCGQFESGNLRLAGHANAADDKEAELVTRYQGHGVEKALAGMQDYRHRTDGIPTLIVEQPAATTTLALKQASASPVFTAKANGHNVDLMLDTGASDLVLGQEQAHNFGVKLLDRSMRVAGILSKDVPAQRGLLDTLQFGDITLRNVPVIVVPQSIALLGANLVAPLGALRVSRSALTISGTTQVSSHSTCDAPMLIASDVWGRTLTVVPQLLINGTSHAVMLDTGAARYLIGSKQALNEVTTLHRGKSAVGDIGDTYAFASVKNAKVNLTIAGQPIDMYFDVYSNSDTRWAITLGAGALRDMDFVFDFRHQHMCFELHPDLH